MWPSRFAYTQMPKLFVRQPSQLTSDFQPLPTVPALPPSCQTFSLQLWHYHRLSLCFFTLYDMWQFRNMFSFLHRLIFWGYFHKYPSWLKTVGDVNLPINNLSPLSKLNYYSTGLINSKSRLNLNFFLHSPTPNHLFLPKLSRKPPNMVLQLSFSPFDLECLLGGPCYWTHDYTHETERVNCGGLKKIWFKTKSFAKS